MSAIELTEAFFISTSPFTHFIFYYDKTGNYFHSLGFVILYGVAACFLVASIIEIIHFRKKLHPLKIVTVFFYTLSLLTAALVQLYYPRLQITSFACTTSCLMAFLTLQNPSSFFDSSTGTLNKIAFREVLLYNKTSMPGSAVIFKHTKTNKIKDLFGIEGRYFITRQFLEQVKAVCEETKIFYLFNDTYVLTFPNKNDAEVYGLKIKELISNPLKFLANQESSNFIEYKISGRTNVLNDFEMLTQSADGKVEFTIDESIALINSIAVAIQPHHFTIIDDSKIKEFQEQMRLHRIVDNDIKNESFEVFLQPIYSIKENAFVSAEALIRLKDEDGTYIPPLAFIPEAEANGDIIQISDIMIQKTCDFINETNLFDKGIQTVNINLSMIQCMYEGIVDHICEILNRNNISPTLIRFEITESVAAHDEALFARLLEEMTAKGIEYALDDYGTGYSNTSSVLSHKFSEIKFDKSLIDSALAGSGNDNALKYLFDITKEKNMVSLAEGVESKEAVELLKKIGCDLIQGFYFAEPMPVNEFKKFLSENF